MPVYRVVIKSIRLKTPNDPFSCAKAPPEPHKCPRCGFKTGLRTLLRRHVTANHRRPPRPPEDDVSTNHSCAECDFQTFSLLLMTRHVADGHDFSEKWRERDHEPEKVRVLNSSISFRNPEVEVLEWHECDQQEEQKWFGCDRCTQKYFRAEDLEAHKAMVVHENSKKVLWYKCEECSYITTAVKNLYRHKKRNHTKEEGEWFKCQMCDYKVTEKYRLKFHWVSKHLKTRWGQWFKCIVCPHRFSSKEALTSHILKEHPKVGEVGMGSFCCKLCPYKGRARGFLNRHMVYRHGYRVDSGENVVS